jgi:hypothetical protein
MPCSLISPRAALLRLACTSRISPAVSCSQPNEWKLGDFLADPLTVEMLTGPNVKTVTYKENVTGPNIPKEQAIANSEAWHLTDPDIDPMAALDAMPACEDDFAAEAVGGSPASASGSSPGSSASHAATPPKRTRRG